VVQKAVFTRNYNSFFNHFLKYHVKILLGGFNAKVGGRIFSN